ncbi:Coatomer subunit gamma-2 [Smittium culicis]|uniref:Coatomer subunit gamma n=1 Tax=Smittium culicis TaxID=133412 RepID=A0A1R1YTQ8_9FUNG|nr:Coatomer subunit gamma-2 [Smittium culicis]
MSWKKDEDGDELGALMSIDKSAVLQEARIFNESPIRPRQCRLLLAKLMYLIQRGDTLSTTEATELFFSITKLFQNKDYLKPHFTIDLSFQMPLRQMVYYAIKELSEISQDVIMVTSSLMKDMQPKSDDMYRAKAIRALCKITDISMLPGIERFIKSAIVDKNQAISSSALVSSYHLYGRARDIIRRWSGEVQEVLSGKSNSSGLSFFSSASSSPITNGIEQYHALGMLYTLKQNDRMAVAKIVQNFGSGSRGGWDIKNPLAHVLLIRYAMKVMSNDPSLFNTLCSMLEEWVRYRSEIVSLEAARAICNFENAPQKLISSAVSSLQSFLSSSKAAVRFGAIRTLDSLALKNPKAVQPCNMDMETLVSDNCRPVATLAITALLKTGNETSVDRLMKVMQGFLTEISDEFRTIVANAVQNLCVKFPQKHAIFLTFLSGALRDEGGYAFKKSIVDAIIGLAKTVEECRETALRHLCEFIEDCEFSRLSVHVLHFLGVEGPATSMPSVYIRHIYNRVVLENPQVRAAAVLALAKFGSAPQADGKLRNSIQVLLRRCLDDRDDEVRDRAVWALRFIQNDTKRTRYMRDDSTYSMQALENRLVDYLADSTNHFKEPVSITSIPKISRDQEIKQKAIISESHGTPLLSNNNSHAKSGASEMSSPAIFSQPAATATNEEALSELKSVHEFESFGDVLVSSQTSVELTEPETEYTVLLYKHIYPKHIVFQFRCTNTLNENKLEQVYVDITCNDESLEESLSPVSVVPIDELNFNEPKSSFVAFERIITDEESSEIDPNVIVGGFDCELKFKVFECDPATGEKLDPEDTGFEEEYSLEPFELTESDYILASYISNWKDVWDSLDGSDGVEASETNEAFRFPSFTSLQNCVDNVAQVLGMYPATNSDLHPTNKVAHQAVLMGLFMGKTQIIVRARMTFAKDNGATLDLCVRCQDPSIRELVVALIA